MLDETLVFNTLTTDETRLIQAMRRSISCGISVVPDHDDEPLMSRFVVQLKRFINLLWRDDPFVVDLRPFHDPRPSPFELQLLYIISEVRARHTETVEELLSWWFTPGDISEARIVLMIAADILDENGFADQSSDRLRAHMLATTSSRVKSRRPTVLNQGVISQNRSRRAAITLH